jgi:sulfate transport system permease protein
VAWPLALVIRSAFDGGLDNLRGILDDPDMRHALGLTVPGGGHLRRPEHRLRRGHLDPARPLRVPGPTGAQRTGRPAVVGLADRRRLSLVLVYGGRTGWFGPALEDAGLQVIFATPGIVLATVFVALPLVIREVVPLLEEVGVEQELAAQSLGASALQTFRRITLPSISGAIVYGVVLSLARSLGEFGAVKVSREHPRADPHGDVGRRGEVPELRPRRCLRDRVPPGAGLGDVHRRRHDHPTQRGGL